MKKKYCTNCGMQLINSPKFCGECGEETTMKIVETNKNEPTAKGIVTCPRCLVHGYVNDGISNLQTQKNSYLN